MKGGSPTLHVDGGGLSVAIVAASWHTTVMDGLIDGARRGLADAGVLSVGLFGIRGGTPHFDYICQAATMGLTDVGVRTGVPVGFGVLTCDDEQQALDRAGLEGSSEDKGHEAATAAVATAITLRALEA